MLQKFLISILLALFSLTSFATSFKDLVIFGDSLSDNGNLYRYLMHIMPKSPPYYKGRFSNGPTWAELLNKDYFTNTELKNFAVGGAGATIADKQMMPYTLTTEVSDYLYLHNYSNKDRSLYVIWIGANNYLNGPKNVDEITTSVIKSIRHNIEELINHDATMFMLVNLPDMGASPQASKNKTNALLTELTNTHNKKLYDEYITLQKDYPSLTFAYFDANASLNEIMSNPAAYNITNTQTPCYGGGYTLMPKTITDDELDEYLKKEALDKGLNLDKDKRLAIINNPSLREALLTGYKQDQKPTLLKSEPLNCTGFMFWDHMHPTDFVHQLIAHKAKAVLESASLWPDAS